MAFYFEPHFLLNTAKSSRAIYKCNSSSIIRKMKSVAINFGVATDIQSQPRSSCEISTPITQTSQTSKFSFMKTNFRSFSSPHLLFQRICGDKKLITPSTEWSEHVNKWKMSRDLLTVTKGEGSIFDCITLHFHVQCYIDCATNYISEP